MNIRNILSLTFIIKPRHRRIKSGSISGLKKDLESAQKIFSNVPFSSYLIGGLGLAIRQSNFYRNHRDLDIAIFINDLEKLIESLERNDYQLMNRHLSTHISPWHNLQVVTKFNSNSSLKKAPEKLRIRAIRKRGSAIKYARKRIEFFDIFLLGKTNNGVIHYAYDVTVPWNDFLPTQRISENSNLYLPNINYKKFLPPINEREKMDFVKANIKPISLYDQIYYSKGY